MMNRETGRWIDSELEHIRQSVTDILTTLLKTRVFRRLYGSAALDEIDARVISATLIRLASRAASALSIWEPRITVKSVVPEIIENGVSILITAEVKRTGKTLTTQVLTTKKNQNA